MSKIEYRADSVYRDTNIEENRFLGMFRSPVQNTQDYLTYRLTVSNKYAQRPDLLAYDLYGNSRLWWVFAQFNPDTLNDPIVDFVAGLEIVVPEKFV